MNSAKNKIRISQATRYQNAALNYYMGMTSSPYLHYGYWEPVPNVDEELKVTELRAAQQAYIEKLVTFIPATARTVLDVGCGTGGNAAFLIERNFKVEGLAPDPFQQEKFLKSTQGRAMFHLTRFEDFRTSSTYDLVFLSESSQYMAAHDIAEGAARVLNQGGYLLLADMMRSDAKYDEGIFSNCHVVEELQRALVQAGFTLVQDEDISKQIAPTIDLCVEKFRTFGLSTIRYLADLVAIAVPPLYKLLSWMFKRRLQKLIVEGLEARKIFEQHLCYRIQLWQLKS